MNSVFKLRPVWLDRHSLCQPRDVRHRAVGLLLLILLLHLSVMPAASASSLQGPMGDPIGAMLAETATPDIYTHYHSRRSSADGIGKVYLGREISQVMGHRGAAWLERPSRSWEEHPADLVQQLNLSPADVVADIGAGTGYMTFRLSSQVPEGQVYAVDIQPEILAMLQALKQNQQADNVIPILGSETDPHLPPQSIDLALLVDAYHEFAYPYEMMTHLVSALKSGGQVALVEYRGENPFILIKRHHKMTQRQVRREMNAVGLLWQETLEFLPQQHVMIFRKP